MNWRSGVTKVTLQTYKWLLETFITPCIELSPLELVKQGCAGKTTFSFSP